MKMDILIILLRKRIFISMDTGNTGGNLLIHPSRENGLSPL